MLVLHRKITSILRMAFGSATGIYKQTGVEELRGGSTDISGLLD